MLYVKHRRHDACDEQEQSEDMTNHRTAVEIPEYMQLLEK
jgi:hypothetical protein